MKILVTGGTGFIGSALIQRLHIAGHDILVYSRDPESGRRKLPTGVRFSPPPSTLPADSQIEVIINLAGEPIGQKRWSKQRKSMLLQSRLDTTQELVDYIARSRTRPKLLLSGSAVGFYGNQQNNNVDEYSEPEDCFSHTLCQRWEEQALVAEEYGVRVALLRIGVVIGKDGGVLKKMRLPYLLGAGATLGSGNQWLSWIHLDDLVALADYLINAPDSAGIYNATAPNPVTNREFTQALAAAVNRPAFFKLPAMPLRWLLGEMSELLLHGQRVFPERARQMGFRFQYPEISTALEQAMCQ